LRPAAPLLESPGEVEARAEPAAGAAQHHHLDGGVAIGLGDRLLELEMHGRDDGVEAFGPVERQRGDRTLDVVAQCLELQAFLR
jgi:hypothetical protein